MWRLSAVVGLGALVVGLAYAVAAQGAANHVCSNEVLTSTYQNVTVAPGKWCELDAATVLGNFQASNASSIGVWGGTNIAGNVQISGTTSNPTATGQTSGGSHNYFCNTKVGGDVQIVTSGSAAPWNIGGTAFPASPDFSMCGKQSYIGGNLQFMNNVGTGSNDISGNDIEGNLQCQNNSAFVTPDTLNGADGNSEGQCATFGAKGDTTEPQSDST